MEHLNFEITEMEHLNFLEFWEETRTTEPALGWKLGIMYTFVFWNTSIQIPNDAPVHQNIFNFKRKLLEITHTFFTKEQFWNTSIQIPTGAPVHGWQRPTFSFKYQRKSQYTRLQESS